MSNTKIRGNTQIMDLTIDLGRLQQSFINSSTGDWNITNGGQDALITGIKLAPSNDSDVASKWYVDQQNLVGVEWKTSVQFTTSTGGVGTYSASGGSSGTGAFTSVDLTGGVFDFGGHTVAVGDRVLVKNQADAKQNGIYIVTSTGATGGLERADDMDGTPSAEVSIGNATFIENGYTYESTHWVVVKPTGYDGNGVLTLNTHNIDWTIFSGTGTYTAGDGLDLTGSQFSVDVTDFIDTAAGLTESGNDIQVNLDASGALSFNAGAIQVTVDDSSIGINGSNQLYVKDDGITDAMISWGTSTGQVSAEDMPIADAGGYFTTDNVEAALQELGANQAAAYAFGTFVPTAGDNVVADVPADTITLTSSSGVIVITGTSSGDVLDFDVAADGIKDYHIDWGIGSNQVSGVDIPLDSSGFTKELGIGDTDVQTALATLDQHDHDDEYSPIGHTHSYAPVAFDTIVPTTGENAVADSTGDTLTLQSSSGVLVITGLAGDILDFDIAADSINDTHINWGIGSNQVSGGDIPLVDSGNYFTTDDVESALQELAQNTPGIGYTEVWGEAPSLDVGAETATLANTPVVGSVRVYMNGLRLIEGAGDDYTISGGVITFTSPGIQPNDVVTVDYKY